MVIFTKGSSLENWKPKTELGKKVKSGEITNLDFILDRGYKILEAEIVDTLVPGLEVELLEVGQSKGKFGGGKSSIWKQTQKKTCEGNVIKFSACVIVGDKNHFIGMGYGSARETVPAREKAIRSAKLNIVSIKKGCGSWACGCGTLHSLPFEVGGRCGSVKVILRPAPRGTGLVVAGKCKKILELAGLKDIYSKSKGKTSTRLNFFKAFFEALKSTSKVRVPEGETKQ